MGEIIDMANKLQATPDLFPWVCLVIILFIVYKERGTIRELMESVISAKKETTIFHAQQNELVRNNTAALENNTAALELVKKDREIMMIKLEQHEQASIERTQHLQKVLNRVDEQTRDNSRAIAVVKTNTYRAKGKDER